MRYAQRLKSDGAAAFREIYDDLAPGLRYFASRYRTGREAVDDLVQDAFVSLWEHRATMPEGGSVKAYLYRSVHFACMNDLRHARVRKRFLADFDSENDRTFLDEVQEAEIFRALFAVFEGLSPASKEVYTLSLGGMSHAEIAQRLGITVNTVKKHKNNANHLMRSRMKHVLCLPLFF